VLLIIPKLVKPRSFAEAYVSSMVFVFSGLALILPGGYSYGPALLFLGSLTLALSGLKVQLKFSDWAFMGALLLYVLVNFVLNWVHGLTANSYDRPLKCLLAIPVYLLLITYPPKEFFFWSGLVFGALGAAFIAFCQQFELLAFSLVLQGRSGGFLNPIQFGNISFLVAVFLLPFFWSFSLRRKHTLILGLILLSSLLGFMAALMSLTRGCWVSTPFILFVIYKNLNHRTKRLFSICLCVFFFIFVATVFFLPFDHIFKSRLFEAGSEIGRFAETGVYDVDTSIGSRLQMWKIGINSIKERPVFGWGDLAAIKAQFPSEWVELNRLYDFNHLHNEYIDILAKKGVAGFSVLMCLFLIPLLYFLGILRTQQTDILPFAINGVLLIVCVMTFGLTQCFLAHNSGTMVFVFYLVIIKAYCRNIVAAREKVVDSVVLNQ
jgi:O-antigen ligase